MTEKKRAIQINPLDITESLGYTTYRRDSRKPWTKEEDVLLGALMNEKLIELGYPDGINSLSTASWEDHSVDLPQRIDWDLISDRLKTRKPKDCRKRWTNSLDPTLKKGKWTAEEDQRLLSSFEKHGSSWQKISLDIPGRTDDQCAKRYIEVLDPNTKDRLRPWLLDEDLSLIKKVKTYGTKWRTISLEMESRPSLTCRNRWRKIVTDVVRGKAAPDIKKEIDSIQGGLSKIAEISENLKTRTKKEKDEPAENDEDEEISDNDIATSDATVAFPTRGLQPQPIIQSRQQQQQQQHQAQQHQHQQYQNQHNQHHPQQHQQQKRTNKPNAQSMGNNFNAYNSPPFGLPSSEPKPASTDVDWKYTLKDTSGLSVSSGAISTTDLARHLIETAKQNDLKISIHQHIHHHYGPTPTHTGKGQSPEQDSGSNISGHNDEHLPNRYTHFNYLPAMVRPQLESSSLDSKESDLNRLLNPGQQQHQVNQHTQQKHPSHSSHQYQSTSSKRRLSNSSNNSRKRSTGQQSQVHDPFSHEELDGELDFWETMRSLSQVVNINSSLTNNKVEYYDQPTAMDVENDARTTRTARGNNNTSSITNDENDPDSSSTSANNVNSELNGSKKRNNRLGNLFYSTLAEEDLEDDLNDLKGIILPFNPS